VLAVLDYGGGNLGSLLAALRRRVGAFAVTPDANEIAKADTLIFPGDGAFAATMEALRLRDLDRAIWHHIERGKPFLGICVGMQILFERSEEFEEARGLGVFRGTIGRFQNAPRVPHMGWNTLDVLAPHRLLEGLPEEPYAYFLHSYRAPVISHTIAAATHGERFSAVVAREAVMGTQFHPEKSRETGARLLDNFLTVACEV
jgi:glutamine amidotransferase